MAHVVLDPRKMNTCDSGRSLQAAAMHKKKVEGFTIQFLLTTPFVIMPWCCRSPAMDRTTQTPGSPSSTKRMPPCKTYPWSRVSIPAALVSSSLARISSILPSCRVESEAPLHRQSSFLLALLSVSFPVQRLVRQLSCLREVHPRWKMLPIMH